MRLAAQEAVAVGKHFERAGAAHDFAAFDLAADDADDQLGPVLTRVFGDPFALGKWEELGHRQAIEIVEPGRGAGTGRGRRRGRGVVGTVTGLAQDALANGRLGGGSGRSLLWPIVASSDGHGS